jgi:glycosyltransferase involved in cell wall biosynthesis
LRILQVNHQFPPHSFQGSEVYCYNLSRRLNESEEVRVFHVSNAKRRWRRRVIRTTHAGLAVYHCIDWGEYARLADWPNEFLRASFQSVLDEFRPEVVHVHNFLSLGDDLVSLAHARGAAVVYTLHDYGLICPNGLLLRDDGKLCEKQAADFFQDCCPTLIRTDVRRRTPQWTARFPSLARWLLYSRQHPHPLFRALLRAGTDRVANWLGHPRRTDIERKRDFFFTHTREVFRDVDMFLAPSEFLLQRYVSCGLPRDKIVHARYGMRLFPAPRRDRRPGPVRFGYIGALHSQKGLELLLDAFRGLGEQARLHVYGSAFGSPISEGYWRRIRDRNATTVSFHGAYDNDRVGEILADLDAVVVPSLWYENSPLTIQEAFIAGVPVITANCGGMAELVGDGVNGLCFRLGDAVDLRAKLRTVVEHPEILDHLRRGIPPVPGIEAHAAEILVRYRELTSKAAPARR